MHFENELLKEKIDLQVPKHYRCWPGDNSQSSQPGSIAARTSSEEGHRAASAILVTALAA